MPAVPRPEILIDIWTAAFPHTQLLMNFDEPQALAYGTKQGAGWRLDCLGDMRSGFGAMLDQYPQEIARTGIQDVLAAQPRLPQNRGTPSSWKKMAST